MKKNPGMAKLPTAVRNKMGFMKEGGMAKGSMPAALAKHASMKASKAHAGLKSGGMTKLSKGGGIETKGKTKGKMITMKSGGRAC